MSLRFKIIALFTATLIITLGVSAFLGAQGAAQMVDDAIRERTLEVARALRSELDLSRELDAAKTADRLVAALHRYRGIRGAEIAVRRLGKDNVVRLSYGPTGPQVTFESQNYPFPSKVEAQIIGQGDTRAYVVSLPVKDSFSHTVATIRLEAALGDEQVSASARRVFLAVAALGGLILVGALTLILKRQLADPLSRLAEAMAAVESGSVDLPAIPGARRQDEIGVVARGLEAMLDRIRGFSQELQVKIDAATTDLARKNRELGELNDLLVEARRDLTAKERLAALGQISGTIAHELGNPLNAMSGHVQLLVRDPDCPSAMRDELTVIEGEVKRMTAIIRRFLDSARPLSPAPQSIEIAALVDEALSLTLSAEARARLEVTREIPSDMGPVLVDPSLVRHVLSNFLSNAVDAMPHGGHLAVRAGRSHNGLLALSVRDTGPGIPPEERKHIFEPFYTTKPPGKGTGLGLAICREIASALKGRIEIDSHPGTGSTFTLYLPVPVVRASA